MDFIIGWAFWTCIFTVLVIVTYAVDMIVVELISYWKGR